MKVHYIVRRNYMRVCEKCNTIVVFNKKRLCDNCREENRKESSRRACREKNKIDNGVHSEYNGRSRWNGKKSQYTYLGDDAIYC